MKKFVVETKTPYSIFIGTDLLKILGALVNEAVPPCKACIITDSSVSSLYSQVVTSSLMEHGYQTSKVVFPSGEHSKNLTTYSNILEALADEGLNRYDMIVSLGGGVVGDMAGFVASTYMRGIRYIQIPTTLMAATDSAIGGKTGINLLSGKNLVGAFWQPSMVICDYKTFDTLPEDKKNDGLAEIIKNAVVSDASLLSRIKSFDYEYIIERCISIKKSIVEADERDTSLRQLLNFGHTIAHGIEKLSSYSVPHGSAVAKGMVAEAKGAYRLGLTSSDISDELWSILSEMGFDLSIPYSSKELYRYALMDKKVCGDSITMVVPEKVGKCRLHRLPISELGKFIDAGIR